MVFARERSLCLVEELDVVSDVGRHGAAGVVEVQKEKGEVMMPRHAGVPIALRVPVERRSVDAQLPRDRRTGEGNIVQESPEGVGASLNQVDASIDAHFARVFEGQDVGRPYLIVGPAHEMSHVALGAVKKDRDAPGGKPLSSFIFERGATFAERVHRRRDCLLTAVENCNPEMVDGSRLERPALAESGKKVVIKGDA